MVIYGREKYKIMNPRRSKGTFRLELGPCAVLDVIPYLAQPRRLQPYIDYPLQFL